MHRLHASSLEIRRDDINQVRALFLGLARVDNYATDLDAVTSLSTTVHVKLDDVDTARPASIDMHLYKAMCGHHFCHTKQSRYQSVQQQEQLP